MSRRSEFRFSFTATDVQNAAQKKADYHREKEKSYRAEAEQLEIELGGSLQLREHQVTGGKQFSPVVDPEKLNAYNDRVSRQERHRKDAEQYESWVRAFGIARKEVEKGAPMPIFQLDIDDVTYFGL